MGLSTIKFHQNSVIQWRKWWLPIFKSRSHSFAISFEPILCVPFEPQNHCILYLTSPSIQIDIRRSSTLWPLALSLLHLLVPVTYCEPWMLIRSWSSRLPDSIWVFYAGGQRSCDWGKEIFAAFFPVAVLWALSISTLLFNLQCLTPSVICSGLLYVKSDTVFMEGVRKPFYILEWKDFVSLEIQSFANCC